MSTEQVDRLIAAVENINANIFALREEIKSGIQVYTGSDGLFLVSSDPRNEPLEVIVKQEEPLSVAIPHVDVEVLNTLNVSNADI